MTTANEALAIYTREDVNLPRTKAVQKATEAITHASEAVMPIINQVFQLNSNRL